MSQSVILLLQTTWATLTTLGFTKLETSFAKKGIAPKGHSDAQSTNVLVGTPVCRILTESAQWF
jgi:hypothetical protein